MKAEGSQSEEDAAESLAVSLITLEPLNCVNFYIWLVHMLA